VIPTIPRRKKDSLSLARPLSVVVCGENVLSHRLAWCCNTVYNTDNVLHLYYYYVYYITGKGVNIMDNSENNGRYTLQIRCTDEIREQFKAMGQEMNKTTGSVLQILMDSYTENKKGGGVFALLRGAGKEGQEVAGALETLGRVALGLSDKSVSLSHEIESTRQALKEEHEQACRHYEERIKDRDETIERLESKIQHLKALEGIADSAQKNYERLSSDYETVKAENRELKEKLSALYTEKETAEKQAAELRGKLTAYGNMEKAGILRK